MGQQSETSFEPRTVDKWIKRARDGRIAVADFQRSFVWPPEKAARYIYAILRGRPVGVYLILNSAEPPQFSPRPFSNMDTPLDKVQELVLDGQQRLSSLLHALYEHRRSRFFIEVEDFAAEQLAVKNVIAYGKNTADAMRLTEAAEAFRSQLIPVDVLRRLNPGESSDLPLTQWCNDVMGGVDSFETYSQMTRFQNKITQFAEECFFQRQLRFYRLSEGTSAAEATEIFVETNTSSMQIKKFDEQVAKVRGGENQDFRKMIGKARRDSEVLRYFFPGDEEQVIPKIGTWLLKLGCLHVGEPPKRGLYGEGRQYLFRRGREDGGVPENFHAVVADVEWVLKRVSDMGSPTGSTLPSWPPVHVLAAARSCYSAIQDPEEANAARRLIDAYYWRSLFTGRYEQRANDRLRKDLDELLKVLRGEEPNAITMRIFSDRHHPLYRAEWLAESAGWIGKSRLGKALVAVVMASQRRPVDWITGEPLRATHVRQLEQSRNLDRHHVFPRNVLRTAGVPEGEIDNGLNGVVLDKRTNRRFWKYPPHEYVVNVTRRKGITEEEFYERITGHLVPHEDMISTKGEVITRYRRFLKHRSELLEQRIRDVAQLPGQA